MQLHSVSDMLTLMQGNSRFDSDVRTNPFTYAPAKNADIYIIQNSNIVELFTMLKKSDRDEQMVYYQVRLISNPQSVSYQAVGWDRDVHFPGSRYTARSKDLQDAG